VSGEVNYRNFAGTPGKNPKYLSDSLTNWYGNWSAGGGGAAIGIAYDNLPIGDAIARITRAVSQFGTNIFEFNEPQNIDGLQLEFYVKAENADVQLYLDISPSPAATWNAPPYGYRLLYAGGACPTVWTKQTIALGKQSFNPVGGLTVNRSLPYTRCKSLVFYRDLPVAVRTLEISGMTIRRL